MGDGDDARNRGAVWQYDGRVAKRGDDEAERTLMRQLAALKEQPAAQSALAVRLVADQTHPLVLEAALAVLGERPQADAREALIALFQGMAGGGKTVDPGRSLR